MRLILLILSLLTSIEVLSQINMNVYRSNGTVVTVPVSLIDSINYSVSTTGVCNGTTILDIDGNVYNIISIGSQCWMQDNLRTSHYSNGNPIPTGLIDSLWAVDTIGAYAIYNNSPSNDAIYGKLYNAFAVASPDSLCPSGWHVPDNSDWNVLVKFVEPGADTTCNICTQSGSGGGKFKEAGLIHWGLPNTCASNTSGFTALPGGNRTITIGAIPFEDLNTDAYFATYWDNTSIIKARWFNNGFCFFKKVGKTKQHGLSVRCVMD